MRTNKTTHTHIHTPIHHHLLFQPCVSFSLLNLVFLPLLCQMFRPLPPAFRELSLATNAELLGDHWALKNERTKERMNGGQKRRLLRKRRRNTIEAAEGEKEKRRFWYNHNNSNNNVHLSCTHQRPESSHDTY